MRQLLPSKSRFSEQSSISLQTEWQRWWNGELASKVLAQTFKSALNFVARKEFYERNMSHDSCWVGKVAIIIEGDVLPCILIRDKIADNVKDQSLKDIIKSYMLNSGI